MTDILCLTGALRGKNRFCADRKERMKRYGRIAKA